MSDDMRNRLAALQAEFGRRDPIDRTLTAFIASGLVAGAVVLLCIAAAAVAVTVKFVGWLFG